jgi:hypothetical protein
MFKNLFSRNSIVGSIVIRVVGIFMAFFLTGAGVASTTPVGWFWGGIIAVGTVLGTIVTVLGVILIWKAHWTLEDVEKTFRAVVAQQAEDNETIADALKVAEMEEFTFDDFGDLDEEDPA